MFSSLNWLSFTERVQYQKSILMYKIVHGMVPEYLLLQNDVQSHCLRSSSNNDIFLPRPNTNFYKKSFHYSAVEIWNKLPACIKCCNTLEIFKKHCFEYFLANAKHDM